LKQLARELDVPVVCAAQLRRDAEGKKPQLSDFSVPHSLNVMLM
jgi:replicative DNA helicase